MKPTIRCAGLASALLTLSTGVAWAAPTGIYTSHFVTGIASAGAPGDGRGGAYQCNTQAYVLVHGGGCGIVTDPGANRVTDGGATVYSGTAGGSIAMTAFNAQVRANEFTYTYPDGVQTVQVLPGFSEAQAGADLANASLRARVNNNANFGYVAGRAQADLHDIVQLHVAGASANTVTRVQFQFAIDGTYLDDLQTTVYGERGSGSLNAVLRLDHLDSASSGGPDHWLAAYSEWSVFRGALQSNTGGQDIRGAHVGGSWTTVSVEDMVFDGWMDIIGTSAIINPTLSLSLDCQIGLQCDYGNTAKFSFTNLPSNVSYTSSSGVFLSSTQPPTGVPEPASAALMLAALVALRLNARRGITDVCRSRPVSL